MAPLPQKVKRLKNQKSKNIKRHLTTEPSCPVQIFVHVFYHCSMVETVCLLHFVFNIEPPEQGWLPQPGPQDEHPIAAGMEQVEDVEDPWHPWASLPGVLV